MWGPMKDEVKVSPPEPEGEARDRKRRFLIFWVILAVVFFGGNFLYGMVLYTRTDRALCLNCHRFAGPARMWERSERHSEGLSCPQCHGTLPAQQGRCNAFSAHAEVVNPNCMGCHARVLEGGPIGKVAEVKFGGEPGGEEKNGIVYRWRLEDLMYTWHVKKRICLCTDCHRNVAHEKSALTSPPHMPRLAYCRECHYHAAKDDYVKASPLPQIRVEVIDAAGK